MRYWRADLNRGVLSLSLHQVSRGGIELLELAGEDHCGRADLRVRIGGCDDGRMRPLLTQRAGGGSSKDDGREHECHHEFDEGDAALGQHGKALVRAKLRGPRAVIQRMLSVMTAKPLDCTATYQTSVIDVAESVAVPEVAAEQPAAVSCECLLTSLCVELRR